MKPVSLKHSVLLLIAATFAISCDKDPATPSTAGKTGHGNVSYFAKASGNGTPGKLSSKSAKTLADVQVAWSSASIYVEKISFTGKGQSVLDTSIVVEKNLNIFTGDALAGVFKLPAKAYKDVKAKLYLKKSMKSELAFDIRGTFTNTQGGTDSIIVGSSYPFEADLAVTEITIDPSDNYKATFNFDLNKILTGISTSLLQTAQLYVGKNGLRTYVIWKGGSQDVPLYAQVTTNWQSVASAVITRQ